MAVTRRTAALAGKVQIPVYVRVGTGSEWQVGNVAIVPGADPGPQVAALLRKVADEMDRQDAAEAGR